MKVSTEIDNNFGYEKITIVVDNISLMCFCSFVGLVGLGGTNTSTDNSLYFYFIILQSKHFNIQLIIDLQTICV